MESITSPSFLEARLALWEWVESNGNSQQYSKIFLKVNKFRALQRLYDY